MLTFDMRENDRMPKLLQIAGMEHKRASQKRTNPTSRIAIHQSSAQKNRLINQHNTYGRVHSLCPEERTVTGEKKDESPK